MLNKTLVILEKKMSLKEQKFCEINILKDISDPFSKGPLNPGTCENNRSAHHSENESKEIFDPNVNQTHQGITNVCAFFLKIAEIGNFL